MPNRSEQVGLDRRCGQRVVHGGAGLVGGHDPALLISTFTSGWVVTSQSATAAMLAGSRMSSSREVHAGTGRGGLPQGAWAAAGDDDRVAESVKRLGEPLADARAAAGDENRVAGHFHGYPLLPIRR